MLSVVLVLILIIGGFFVLLNSLNIPKIRELQRELPQSLKTPGFSLITNEDVYEIRAKNDNRILIKFEPDLDNPMLQRIYFSDEVLFKGDSADLDARGRDVLQLFARAVARHLSDFTEIQIHGHADPRRPTAAKDNLELGSFRANAVFRFLESQGIDPLQASMSATSFGHFFPVTRKPGESFSAEMLEASNASDEQLMRNRRIELLLFYRRQNF